ncbi:hypothetical protein [Idiomarina loihiensis]|uniref:hypothetical protein n=1 Tax=Idiomarina loihiensis TaxID=135577 RepID=UPI00384C700B
MTQPRWVKLKHFSELTGITPKAVYAYAQRGRWMLSREYRKVNGKYFINLDAYYRWVENNG